MRIFLAIALFATGYLSAKEAANYDESKVPPYTLPDVLTTLDGRKITTEKEWREIRRPEVLELFKTHVYGRSPGRPENMTFKVVSEKPDALDGKADGKQIDITIVKNDKSLTIRVNLFIPKQSRPAPAFLLICNRPPTNIDFTRETKSPFGPQNRSSRGAMRLWRSTMPMSIRTKTTASRTASMASSMETRNARPTRGVRLPLGLGVPVVCWTISRRSPASMPSALL